jgi:hypothetical protein
MTQPSYVKMLDLRMSALKCFLSLERRDENDQSS